jgi:hypothetical protein
LFSNKKRNKSAETRRKKNWNLLWKKYYYY